MTPEERKAYNKAYYEANKMKICEYLKAYYQTPAGKKSTTINNWKRSGLIDSDGDNYEKRYQSYLQSTHCAFCKIEYNDTFYRCLDHDHDTKLFRAFLCNPCNICDVLKHQTSS